MKRSILSLLKRATIDAAGSAVSLSGNPGADSAKIFSMSEFTTMFKAGLREIVPDIVKSMKENSTGYGPVRYREWDSLAKSIEVKAWKGPSDRALEVVRMDVKKNCKIHNCLGIIEGTWLESDGIDAAEQEKWKIANTTAVIILSNTFSDYEPSREIIKLYTEEAGLDGEAYECWLELDGEFDDDGVYDRTVLEAEYDGYKLLPHWTPTRFVTKLNNLRAKLARVGLIKDDETMQYDLMKKLPESGEYDSVGEKIQEKLRPRELMKKQRPRPTDEEIDSMHPLMSMKDLKDLLRRRWEWVKKRKPGTTEKKRGKRFDKPGTEDEGKGEEKKRDHANKVEEGFKCYNCGDDGHMSRDCPKGPICNFCGGEGHKSFDCTYAKEAREKEKSKKSLKGSTGKTDSHENKKPVASLYVRSRHDAWNLSPLEGGLTRLEY
jgi:hypothetical protein